MRLGGRFAERDRGAAAVEFALLFPIFMVLALGLIAGGTAFSKQINVTQAAREASRYGATLDIQTQPGASQAERTDAWLAAVDRAARTAAGDQGNPIGGYDYRCVAFVQTDAAGNLSAQSRHSVNGAAGASGICPSTRAASDPASRIANTSYVQVVLSVDTRFFVLFINPRLQLDAISSTPYERSAA